MYNDQGLTYRDHPIWLVVGDVDATHPGLGRLVAFELVAAKAKKCLLVVASAGCGKSAALEVVSRTVPGALFKDSMTRSSLKSYQEAFTGFTGLICCDDVGKIDTEWSQQQFLTTMAELCYGHFVSKDSVGIKVEINDFFGSCVLNIQPPILASIVRKPTWHSNLADKTIRYYHLRRAIEPALEPLEINLEWGKNLDSVEKEINREGAWPLCLAVGLQQWTTARAIEHTRDLARALAAYDNRETVTEVDLELLLELMRPLTVEMEVIEKQGFETKATMNSDMLYLLVEFATYSTVTPATIASDYHMHVRTVNRLLESMVDYYQTVSLEPRRIGPTKEMVRILERVGVR